MLTEEVPFTTEQVRETIRRAADLLADESRVVLDPACVFESSDGVELNASTALAERTSCRVCVWGALQLAAHEVLGCPPLVSGGERRLADVAEELIGDRTGHDVVTDFTDGNLRAPAVRDLMRAALAP